MRSWEKNWVKQEFKLQFSYHRSPRWSQMGFGVHNRTSELYWVEGKSSKLCPWPHQKDVGYELPLGKQLSEGTFSSWKQFQGRRLSVSNWQSVAGKVSIGSWVKEGAIWPGQCSIQYKHLDKSHSLHYQSILPEFACLDRVLLISFK